MVARTWIGPNGGAWNTASNWNPTNAPNSTDEVTISGFTGTIIVYRGFARHITIQGSSNVTFEQSSTWLEITGDLLVSTGSTLNTDFGIRFTGSGLVSNWTPGSGTYKNIDITKGPNSSLDIRGPANITGQFIYVTGTINQYDNISIAYVNNIGTSARTWNMNGKNVNVTGLPTSAGNTNYNQNNGTCTFGGTRGYFIMADGTQALCAQRASQAPSISIPTDANVVVRGHVWDLEVKGNVLGVDTTTYTITLWNNFSDNATSTSTIAATKTNLILVRSSPGTYTYNSYYKWKTILFGQPGGTNVTWNITRSRANSITCSGTEFTYNLSDCTFSTNDTSGLLNFNCSSSTINLNDIYSSQGTNTQLQFSGSNNTITLGNTNNNSTQVINGSMSFSGSSNTLNIINNFSCRSITHTAGTITIASDKTVKTGLFSRSEKNSAGLVLNGNLEIIYSTDQSTVKFNLPDTTNYTISGDGWVIYRAKGHFIYGGLDNSAINFTTGANTFNIKILQNLDQSNEQLGVLIVAAAKSFTNHEGTFDQMGRWGNVDPITVYIFKDFSVYAPPNDDGTYRNKVGLLNPIFAGTDSNKIHNFGTIGINPGYNGMEPTFSGIRMASSGTLKCLNNVNCNGLPFKHSSGTLELTSSNITCSTIWFGSDGINNSLDTGTRTWIFPAANTHIICTDFSHPTTTGLICSGDYYDSSDPTQISGIYINNSNATTILSGNTANTSTPPNFILSNLATKLNTSFYCNSIRLYSDNVNSNSNIYVDNMWAPTNQSESNIAWQNNINVYMTGIKNGYIDTTGNVSSCPITIVDPGVGNTKTVYTSTKISQTTRIGTITVNNRTILNGNPIPNSSTANNVVIGGLLNLLGSLVIKSGQGWDFTGSGTVFSAASAQNITDNGGIFYFSNPAATQAIFPTTTINNITRNTTSTNTLTITSNNTTIGTIANHINGGGSFAFIDGGLGAPKFNVFNINGTPNAISLITGPVISSGAIFLVEYATVTNSTANLSGKWLGGNGTTDGGGNINWLFGQGINNNDNFFLLIF